MDKKRREYSYDDWKKAMDLYNKYKFGPRWISRTLNIKDDTVKSWLYKGIMSPVAKMDGGAEQRTGIHNRSALWRWKCT